MAEQQTQDSVNEFGTKVASQGGEIPLNEAGPAQGTLEQILAAIRGKDVDAAPNVVPPKVETPAEDPTKVEALPGADDKFETGNKALDVAVSAFVRSTGATDADIQRACQNALDYGDPRLIDKVFLQERFKDRADDAIALAEAVIEQHGIEKQRTVSAVYDLAGSKENWDAALAVYKQHAPAGLQKALGMMFSSGEAASVKEAAALVLEYAKGSGVMTQGGQRQVAGGGPAASEGLSASEFQAAMSKLNPNSRTYHADYSRLMDMRRMGKSLGK